jgi:predicted ArsR family transcriptional regulator
MLDMFEKLINEHGSSAILKERIELISDKYSILEDKLEASNQKNSALEAENKSLKTQLEQANKEVFRLQETIESANKSKSGDKLDEEKENILKVLFESNSNASIEQLAQHFQLQESVVEYHIDDLREKKLLDHGPLIVNHPLTYEISKLGRKYVIEVMGI